MKKANTNAQWWGTRQPMYQFIEHYMDLDMKYFQGQMKSFKAFLSANEQDDQQLEMSPGRLKRKWMKMALHGGKEACPGLLLALPQYLMIQTLMRKLTIILTKVAMSRRIKLNLYNIQLCVSIFLVAKNAIVNFATTIQRKSLLTSSSLSQESIASTQSTDHDHWLLARRAIRSDLVEFWTHKLIWPIFFFLVDSHHQHECSHFNVASNKPSYRLPTLDQFSTLRYTLHRVSLVL